MTTLFAGGLIFDGEGELLDEHGVVVDGDKISRVAPLGEFDGFFGFASGGYDCSNRCVEPGGTAKEVQPP